MDMWLQWGRNLIVAEGRRAAGGGPPSPRASMGPQLDSCGRRAVGVPAAGPVPLQWGRNLIVAEGKLAARFPRDVLASMGPQLDSCGRDDNDRLQHCKRWASMGPQLDSCGR